jgi:hypothetical protein
VTAAGRADRGRCPASKLSGRPLAGQFATAGTPAASNVAHVVLYDDRRLESRRNLFEAEGSGCRSGSTTCRLCFWHCSWS